MLACVVAALGVAAYFSGDALSPVSLFYLWLVAFGGWATEQRFFVAFERSATPMRVTDLGGTIVQANEAFCDLSAMRCPN